MIPSAVRASGTGATSGGAARAQAVGKEHKADSAPGNNGKGVLSAATAAVKTCYKAICANGNIKQAIAMIKVKQNESCPSGEFDNANVALASLESCGQGVAGVQQGVGRAGPQSNDPGKGSKSGGSPSHGKGDAYSGKGIETNAGKGLEANGGNDKAGKGNKGGKGH